MNKSTPSKPPTIKQILSVVGGGLLGLPVGLHLTHLFLTSVGPIVYKPQQWQQIGGALALVTLPFGTMCGLVCGGLLAVVRPRIYLMTFLPLAVLFISRDLTQSYLSTIDRPRKYVIEMLGPKGATYRGVANVDNKAKPIEGILPDRYECIGTSAELAFVLTTPQHGDQVKAKLFANGAWVDTSYFADRGLILRCRSRGYNQWAGSVALTWHPVIEDDELSKILDDQTIPEDSSSTNFFESVSRP